MFKKIDHIKLCFIGCGNITASHAGLVRKCTNNIELAFASRGREKAERYKKKFSGTKSYDSYDAVFSDDWANVVMICTPPKFHYDLAVQALKGGKHVIVEKPPFLKSEDFNALAEIADPAGLQILVAENYFYKPLRKHLIKLLNDPAIGTPINLQITAAKTQKNDDWRDDPSLVGFGSLYEGGIHWISILNNLGYTINSLKGFIPDHNGELEQSTHLSARTDGPLINLFYSWETNSLLNGLNLSRIYGTKGSVYWESNGVISFLRGRKWRLYIPGLRRISGKQSMFEDFFRALKSGKVAEYTREMAQADLALVEKIYISAERDTSID